MVGNGAHGTWGGPGRRLGIGVGRLWHSAAPAQTPGVAGEGRAEVVDGIAPHTCLRAASLLLGTTQKFFFLYDPVQQVTSVVPSNNVARIIVNARKAKTQPAK